MPGVDKQPAFTNPGKSTKPVKPQEPAPKKLPQQKPVSPVRKSIDQKPSPISKKSEQRKHLLPSHDPVALRPNPDQLERFI